MYKKLMILAGMVIVIFVAYIVYTFTNNSEMTYEQAQEIEKSYAKIMCKSLCNQKLNESQILSNSPCLSNHIGDVGSNLYDWVCDVAHSPRQAVDDLPENQCGAYRDGQAHHFVEVDEKCELIRAV